jgi:6-phosphogluconate dehydrogenase
VNVFIESPHCEVYKYCRALFVMDAGYPIGFIGLGTMGEAMALSLVKAGTRLLVWNRTRAKAEILAAAGADIAREAAACSLTPQLSS